MNSLFSLSTLLTPILCMACYPTVASASHLSNPNFSLEFDEFIAGPGDMHTDTHKIIAGKPVSSLTISMVTDFGPDHLPGSEILLDLSGSPFHFITNTPTELSVTVFFDPPLPAGEYPATKVVFDSTLGFYHNTIGTASGSFSDGEIFEVDVYAGFIPEPSSAILFLAGASLLFSRTALRKGKAKGSF